MNLYGQGVFMEVSYIFQLVSFSREQIISMLNSLIEKTSRE